MHCQSLKECFEQIGAYADGTCTSYPLIVNVENFSEYQEILSRLSADETKRCIRVSEHTFYNGLPDVQEVLERIKEKGSFAVFGLSQGLMLHGESELDGRIGELLGCAIRGHAVVVLSHCRRYLEKYLQRDVRLEQRVLLLEGEKSKLPQLCFAKSKEECVGTHIDGIQKLLVYLEQLTDGEVALHPVVFVTTELPLKTFQYALYQVTGSGGLYQAVVQKYADLAAAVRREFGTEEQWAWLLKQTAECETFSALIAARFGTTSNLAGMLERTFDVGDETTKWLHWLAMKVFGTGTDRYLSLALSHSHKYDDLCHHIYQDLLEVACNDERFELFFKERKKLISRLPEALPEVAAYCSHVGRHGKKAAYYLTDATEEEEYAFLRIIGENEWTDEELHAAVGHAFPQLALYLNEFVFDAANTKLPEKDAAFRKTLTEYFHRYKIQKIKNRVEPTFLERVDEFALERPFYKLQPRSSIVAAMEKKGVQAYFFDALGAEHLAYIQAKCEEYGLIYEIDIAHCELPSITSKNKEFQQRFDTRDIRDLDELKHHSTEYDYQTCEYPIYIFRELEIIDRELRKILSQLKQNRFEKAVILSDHGASRLAVLYKHESETMLTLDEKGQHSGRCCPCAEDPGIPQAAYEEGYAILANYERFRGGRRANLEVHGGASLEEVVVPIITISRRPENVSYYFVDPVVKIKVGKPSTIELFSTVPMKQPRLEVEGTFYDGEVASGKNHAVFTLTEQKRVRSYSATVYEGNTNTGVTLEFRMERGTKTRDLFGMN